MSQPRRSRSMRHAPTSTGGRGKRLAAPHTAEGGRLPRPPSPIIDWLAAVERALSKKIRRIDGEERWAEECRFRHAVVAVGQRTEPEQELAVERIGEEQRS